MEAMVARFFLTSLCLVAGLVRGQPLCAHGGAYRGPADSVPGGEASTPPGTPSPAAPAPSGGTGGPVTANVGAARTEPDTSVWQLWWGYNNAAYIDIKRAVHSSDLLRGSASFFLGGPSPNRPPDLLVPTREVIEQRVVPALLRVLNEERDADIVTGALVALAKIGESAAHPTRMSEQISAFLTDDNQEVAETAAISLGILADRGSVEMLTNLLLDRPAARKLLGKSEVPWRTRAFAAFGLGLIGNQVEEEALRVAIVNTLCDALSSGLLELAIPDVAVACLSALGLVPLSTAVTASGVAACGRVRQIDWLLAFGRRTDLDDHVRAHLPTAAARLLIGAPASWGLKRRLGESWIEDLSGAPKVSRAVKQSSVLALGRVGFPNDEPFECAIRAALLRASRESRNVEVRRFVLVAMAQIGSRAADNDVEQKIASEIRDHLTDRLQRGVGDVRSWAALALGVLGRSPSESASQVELRTDRLLVAALGEARAPRDVGACAIACGMRQQKAAGLALLKKLAEVSDDEARGYITLALGMTGATEALEPIEKVVRRSKYRPELLRQAAIGLGLLGDKDVVPELIDMLVRATSLSSQASIAHGLGAIGDARSIDPLIEMLGDSATTPRARAFAAVALGIVSDKEALPWNAKLSSGVNYRANTTTLTDGRGAGILEIL